MMDTNLEIAHFRAYTNVLYDDTTPTSNIQNPFRFQFKISVHT